jgi:hypothetical protein
MGYINETPVSFKPASNVVVPGHYLKTNISRAFTYNYQEAGICGMPLIMEHNTGKSAHGCIVGIHALGNVTANVGWSTSITETLVREAIKVLDAQSKGVIVFQSFDIPVEETHRPRMACNVGGSTVPYDSLGTMGKNRSSQSKSSQVRTEFHEIFAPRMDSQLTIPRLQCDGFLDGETFYSPAYHKAKSFETRAVNWSQRELDNAVEDYCTDMPETVLKQPLNIKDAINGTGDYISGINLSTSMGQARNFYDVKTDILNREELDEDLVKTIGLLIESLDAGEVPVLYQRACLKDEPIKVSKDKVLKYRYFNVSDIPWLVVCRMYLAPILEYLYKNKEFFEAYGVWNPASPEFGEMIERFKKFRNVLFMDISHMDSSHKNFIAEAVGEVVKRMCMKVGYSERDAEISKLITVASVFSILDYNNDLYFSCEGMGSGIFLTYAFNCWVLSLLYRVAWFRICAGLFRKHNVLICGGDDSCLSTANDVYDGVHISEVFRDYGYAMTPAEKDSKVQAFESMSDFVFLQRVPYDLNGQIVGQLKLQSIYKNLCFRGISKNVTEVQQMRQKIDAACRELVLYGEDVYNEHVALLKTKECFGYEFKTYDYLIDKYFKYELYEGIA